MTPREAKKITAQILTDLGLPAHKLTARTVDFTDLARDKTVFVKIHDWKPDPVADRIKAAARDSGFCVEFQGKEIIA